MSIMLDLLKTFRVVLKFDNVRIDNNVFRLHYKLTVILLVVFSLLVTSKQYFGEPIYCHVSSSKSDGFKIDTYCWIVGTFTVKKHLNLARTNRTGLHPGIGVYRENQDEIIKHKYYQWVGFVLAIQAAFFYFPRHLWKTWEGGRMKALASDLAVPILSPDWKKIRKDILLDYFIMTNFHTHVIYAYRYAFCELLNFLNVLAQIYLIDLFLENTFSTYGISVLKFCTNDPEERFDPMARTFPIVAKCTYRSFGPSGSLEIKDAQCMLPLNILNEKIYVFMWFWFVILAVTSAVALLYRAILIFCKFSRSYILMAQARGVRRPHVEKVMAYLDYGDWFVLSMLGRNTNPIAFREIVKDLSVKLPNKARI